MQVFQILSSISSFVVIGFICLLPFLAYRRWYPRNVTCVKLSRGSDPLVYPVKPNKAFFRSVSLNRRSCFVSIGNGYFAYYCEQDPHSDFVEFNQISIASEIYIFSRSRFGRFKSVDLSDRCLLDSLKKFTDKEV